MDDPRRYALLRQFQSDRNVSRSNHRVSTGQEGNSPPLSRLNNLPASFILQLESIQYDNPLSEQKLKFLPVQTGHDVCVELRENLARTSSLFQPFDSETSLIVQAQPDKGDTHSDREKDCLLKARFQKL